MNQSTGYTPETETCHKITNLVAIVGQAALVAAVVDFDGDLHEVERALTAQARAIVCDPTLAAWNMPGLLEEEREILAALDEVLGNPELQAVSEDLFSELKSVSKLIRWAEDTDYVADDRRDTIMRTK